MKLAVVIGAAAQLAAATFGATPTYSKDVAPILFARCAGCHQPDDIAPMSLLSYKETRPWAKAIREAVVKRTMPPWHADPHYGRFANDPRLTDSEVEAIRAWVDAGAPDGDPKDLPSPPARNGGWRLGKPDVVIDIGQDFKVEPSGPDEYTNFTVPVPFAEDRWILAAELRPGNRKVVHHAHAILMTEPRPGEKRESYPKDSAAAFMYREGKLGHMRTDAPVKNDGCAVDDAGNYYGRRNGMNGILASFLPGKGPDAYPPGTAKLIPAASKLRFQLHYSRTGKSETDRTMVGLYFAPKPPDRPLRRMDVSNFLFEIPAGASSQQVTECHTFDKDVELLSLTAHMHFRGKDMRFDLVRPDGRLETLLSVPSYNFAWQTTYRLTEPVKVERGSRLIITAHFDNSPNNRWNPDPSKTIRWGEPSNEEMMDGWLEYVDGPTR